MYKGIIIGATTVCVIWLIYESLRPKSYKEQFDSFVDKANRHPVYQVKRLLYK